MEKYVKVIGSVLCPDCILALAKLREADIETEFHNITGTMQELKDYLALRDSEPLFQEAKKNGMAGIPFFQLPDGTKTFSYKEVIEKLK